MGGKGTFKTCFIAAPLSANIEPLRAILSRRGVRVTDAFSLPPRSSSVVEATEAAIREADFLCAVVTREGSAGVMFQAGIARGARRPLFIVVDKAVELPLDLRALLYVRASLSDTEAIEFSLDQFLEHQSSRPLARPRSAARATAGRAESGASRDIRARLEALESMPPSARGMALEELVSDLLRGAQAVVVGEPSGSEIGADMAIWLDELESSLGNPVLVEVKCGRLSAHALDDAERQLQRYLRATNARTGLLVYLDSSGRRFATSRAKWPLVIRLDVRDLAEMVGEGDLVGHLTAARNRAVHGEVR